MVAEIADRVVVMYAGAAVETGSVEAIFAEPRMPYTRALLNSIPRLDRAREGEQRLEAIPGSVPSPLRLPAGCRFHPRCRHFVRGLCDAGLPAARGLRRPAQRALPALARDRRGGGLMAAAAGPLIEVRHLRTWFPAQAGLLARVKDHVKAVDDVSFDIERGEVLGLVGESGSGKTTVGRSRCA